VAVPALLDVAEQLTVRVLSFSPLCCKASNLHPAADRARADYDHTPLLEKTH
jgi:hypothetical protein